MFPQLEIALMCLYLGFATVSVDAQSKPASECKLQIPSKPISCARGFDVTIMGRFDDRESGKTFALTSITPQEFSRLRADCADGKAVANQIIAVVRGEDARELRGMRHDIVNFSFVTIKSDTEMAVPISIRPWLTSYKRLFITISMICDGEVLSMTDREVEVDTDAD